VTIVPPAPGEPRRPDGPRDPGDAWVIAEDGTRYWGRFGAAGLLAFDAGRGILLQHRVGWSHHGGTWGLPGGARHQGESAQDAALREAHEEAGVPVAAVRTRLIRTLDLRVWSYATVVADVEIPFEPVIGDPESVALRWVPVDEVDSYPLHPGFAAAWPALREALDIRPTLLVDAANVVGSVPDGWWKDRAGAAERLGATLAELAARGIPGSEVGLAEGLWFPEIVRVLEGQARAAADVAGLVTLRAAAAGDDTIADEAARLGEAGRTVIVVTSDRGLAQRVAPAHVVSASRLRSVVDAVT